MHTPSRAGTRPDRHRARGQGLVELALVLPVILMLLLTAIDFGRVYLGWVNLNQMARIAANYAATNPNADFVDPTGAYQTLVLQDARAINCDILPDGGTDTAPVPVFGGTAALGEDATVSITCEFGIITPIISGILGNEIDVTATSTFPIRTGAVNDIPTGGGGTSNVPVAEFQGSPTSGLVGTSGLTVVFQDLSSNAPIQWLWNFGDGFTTNEQNPTHTYTAAGTYTVRLTATNPAGSNMRTRTDYIVVTDNPTGLTANFTADPTSIVVGESVDFTDTTTGGTGPYTYEWDFDNDGTFDSTATNPSHTYGTAGQYTVVLRVTDSTTAQNTITQTNVITVAQDLCTVPNVSDGNTNVSAAMTAITNAGFVGEQVPPNGNWKVRFQSPQGGLQIGCGGIVTVFK